MLQQERDVTLLMSELLADVQLPITQLLWSDYKTLTGKGKCDSRETALCQVKREAIPVDTPPEIIPARLHGKNVA